MAKCELSGKGPKAKNLVSHSNIKTKSVANANIQQKQLWSQSLGKNVSLKMATSTIRNVEHGGGFDSYILKQDDKKLSHRALKVKSQIKRKLNLK